MERIILATGCFWGAQEILRQIPGVQSTVAVYAGGSTEGARYLDVKTGKTGHAESVDVTFDPHKVSLENILDVFFRMHDPTTENRQGNDVGSQYRSAIIYFSPEQKEKALQKINEIQKIGFWKKPIVTEVEAYSRSTKAEDEHQDYLQKHPNGYSCHFMRKF